MDTTSSAVLYHKDCTDGLVAAWAAWLKLRSTANYHPCAYGQPVPEISRETSFVYLLDFSYPKSTIEILAKRFRKVIILDHHISAQKDLEGVPNAVFDMNKSGASLAWEHFHPGKPAPAIVRYTEDWDLWRHQLPFYKEVHYFITNAPMTLLDCNSKAHILDNPATFGDALKEGAAVSTYVTNQVTRTTFDKFPARLAKNPAISVAAVNSNSHVSEVCHALLQTDPQIQVAFAYKVGLSGISWSARSRGDFDVSELATSYGGGGHKAAAGFKTATIDEVLIPA